MAPDLFIFKDRESSQRDKAYRSKGFTAAGSIEKARDINYLARDGGGRVPPGGIPVPYTATTRDWDFNTVNKDPPIRDLSSSNRYRSALI